MPLLKAMLLGLKLNHKTKFKPENKKFIKQKQVISFKKLKFLNPKDTPIIKIAIKIFIIKEKNKFCSGKNI